MNNIHSSRKEELDEKYSFLNGDKTHNLDDSNHSKSPNHSSSHANIHSSGKHSSSSKNHKDKFSKEDHKDKFPLLMFSIALAVLIMITLTFYGILVNSKPIFNKKMGQVSSKKLEGIKRGFLNKATDREVAKREALKIETEAFFRDITNGLDKEQNIVSKEKEVKLAKHLSEKRVGDAIDKTIENINMAGLYGSETVLGKIAISLDKSSDEIRDIYRSVFEVETIRGLKEMYRGNEVIIAVEIFERREQIEEVIDRLE